jgi:hypothetical protein
LVRELGEKKPKIADYVFVSKTGVHPNKGHPKKVGAIQMRNAPGCRQAGIDEFRIGNILTSN